MLGRTSVPRAFLIGLVLGALAGALQACGPTSTALPCLKSNCAGCCDVNGDCQAGTELFACGALGNACLGCSRTDSCVKGSCVPASMGGGTGGGSGGGGEGGGGGGGGGPTDGGCSPANCNGCCEAATGQCRGGNLFAACGMGGVACQRCPTGQTCISFTCQTYQCPGCTDATGACLSGTQNQACGTDGGACVMCPGTQSCLGGACVTATTCGPANCNGCCDGTVCVTSPSASRCGASGNACVTCSGAQQCVGGACGTAGGAGGGSGGGAGGGAGGGSTGGGTGGGSSGNCNPFTCGGCCDSQGVCQAGDQRSACGALGSPCQSCSLACLSGICI
ncbi:MAG: hypothetical protein AMXMBFR34_24750 [Myxococcaceae bacterium]